MVRYAATATRCAAPISAPGLGRVSQVGALDRGVRWRRGMRARRACFYCA